MTLRPARGLAAGPSARSATRPAVRSATGRARRSAAVAVAVGMLVGAGALLPTASADPAGPSTSARTDQAARGNRVPLAPADVRFTVPTGPCATGPRRPVLRSATPTIEAVHRDRDDDPVRAAVTVTELRASLGAAALFSVVTEPQASGARQSVTLGGTGHGRTYRVRTATLDPSLRRGPSVTCEFEVDLVAPGLPTVAPVAAGAQPVYTAGVPAGGVGRPGSFRLGDGGSADVVSYRYSLGSTALDLTAAGRSPVVTVTPTRPGTDRLSVQAVDRAGWVSPVATYDLLVAGWPALPQTLTWRLDEISGTTAASSAPDGSDPLPLTLSPSLETRTGGFLADVAGITTDRALDFDGPDDEARTSGPAVDSGGSYTVSAAVRPSSTGGTATALSQDGTTTAGFQLGYRPCASGTDSCWAFSVPAADSGSAEVTTVVSEVGVQPGAWSEVTGVHDVASGTLRLWVCHPVLDDFGDTAWQLTDAGTVPFTTPWAAAGPLRLGRALGPDPAPWSGAVGQARAAAGTTTQAALLRSCPPLG